MAAAKRQRTSQRTDQSLRLRVIELRAEGTTYAQIAEQLNIPQQTAVDIASEDIDQIGTLRAIQTENFFAVRRVNTQGRIDQLSALQTRVREEIESRDLSNVPTDKLITLFIKLSEALKGEVYTPDIASTEEQEKAKEDRNNWFSA